MDLYAKLSNCMEELSSTFRSRMNQYEEDLKTAASSEPPHKTIASLSREFTDFKCLIWKTMGTLKMQIELLLVGLDRHEMVSRRKVLLLHGLSEQKESDETSRLVGLLTNQMNLGSITCTDIVKCHRLGVNTSKPRPLLIRFQSYGIRREVWSNKTSLKGTGFTLSEFLTKPRHDVFMTARKHFGIKECWSSDGKIIIRIPDKSLRKVESATELSQLMTQFPSQTLISKDKDGAPKTVARSTNAVPEKRLRKPAK